jgi:hypothetical protein
VAAPRGEAVTKATPTNTIALSNFFAIANLGGTYSYSELSFVSIGHPGTYLQDPTVAKDHQPTVYTALIVHLFATGREHGSLGL